VRERRYEVQNIPRERKRCSKILTWSSAWIGAWGLVEAGAEVADGVVLELPYNETSFWDWTNNNLRGNDL